MCNYQILFKLCLLLQLTAFVNTSCCKGDTQREDKNKNPNDMMVKTLTGWVQGVKETTAWGNDFKTFKGIPYAEKPIENNRFKAPTYIKPWNVMLNTTREYPAACKMDVDLLSPKFSMGLTEESEDCLYLNIFVPFRKTNKKLSVIFHIYFGGFTRGRSDSHNPEFFMDGAEVIFVTFNYRGGVFGFLNLGTKDISGNMGLKDQQCALSWVYDNIDSFGGDCNSITLLGCSSGAASAHYHMLSEVSSKMIRRVIIMSGTVLAPYAFSTDKNHKKRSLEIARRIDPNVQEKDVKKLFMKTKTQTIIDNLDTQFMYLESMSTVWAPTIERADAKDPFITKPIEELYKEKKYKTDIDVIFGHTNMEYITFFWKYYKDWTEHIDKFLNMMLPIRNYNIPLNSAEYEGVKNKILQLYVTNDTINETHLLPVLEMLSAMYFIIDEMEALDLHIAHSTAKTFFCRYSIDQELNAFGRLEGLPKDVPTAAHGDETCILFKCKNYEELYDRVFDVVKKSRKKNIVSNACDFVKELSLFKKTSMLNDTEIFAKQAHQIYSSINENIEFVTSFAKTGVPKVLKRECLFSSLSYTRLKPIAQKKGKSYYVDITNDGMKIELMKKDEKLQKLKECFEEAKAIHNSANARNP